MHQVGSYVIGTGPEFSQSQCEALVDVLKQKVSARAVALEGRAPTQTAVIEGVGPVVVKSYARGGLLRHLIVRHHLRWGKIRSEREFDLLRRVRALGVSAPEPVAYAYHGRLFYRAWLVTRKISHDRSLAELSRSDEERAASLTEALVRQISLLISNRVLHIDLHPGNVIVEEDGTLHIVDFDKARLFTGSKNALRDLYLRRWRRAVIKHGLPEILTEIMCLRLRASYE